MQTRTVITALIVCAAALEGCGARSALRGAAYEEDAGANDAGNGGGGAGGSTCDPSGPSTLSTRIRDFHDTHPDFEKFLGDDPGFVAQDLGDDMSPVYAGGMGTLTTTGKDDFDQWYHDVPGVNLGVNRDLPLTPIAGGVGLESDAFFPIDDDLFGNEGRAHNFHFTLEGHTTFRYEGGEIFQFGGDDDFFAFINGKLVLDLGGVHSSEEGTVNVDTFAIALGLTKGDVYPLDVFFAERHTDGSTFHARLLGFRLCQ